MIAAVQTFRAENPGKKYNDFLATEQGAQWLLLPRTAAQLHAKFGDLAPKKQKK
jgi:hypothetical protein